MTDIKALEEQLKAAKEAASAEVVAEAKAIWDARTYDWSVDWHSGWRKKLSQYSFVVQRKLTDTTLAAMADWEARMKTLYSSWEQPRKPWSSSDPRVESMQYVLFGTLMTHVGGGTILLKGAEGDEDAFSHEPRHLTDLEVQALKKGTVPDSLKRDRV